MNKCALILLSILFSFSSGLWGQIDPRIASVLGNLSPQQKQMIASSVGMLEQRTGIKKTDSRDESQSGDQISDDTNMDSEEEEVEEEKVDILQQLIFLEQLLLNDLESLKEDYDEENSEELSANDKLRRLESLEQTKSLIFEIKQRQRDEIQKQSDELFHFVEEELKPFGHDFFANKTNYEFDDMGFVASNYEVGPGDVLEVLLFGQKNEAYNLLINRDGIIQFPNIGPINVFEQGTEFISLKNAINLKIKEHLGEGFSLLLPWVHYDLSLFLCLVR